MIAKEPLDWEDYLMLAAAIIMAFCFICSGCNCEFHVQIKSKSTEKGKEIEFVGEQ